MKTYRFEDSKIPDSFFWFNDPKSYFLNKGLILITKKNTDFWQRTHYGFSRDDGHCLFTKTKGDFSIETKVFFEPKNQYDQAGLMIRADENNWIKCSIEYENSTLSRLGSVITKDGFSDWATTDITRNLNCMYYKIEKHKGDIFIYNSFDGTKWHQMRITHVDNSLNWSAGIYACSPQGENFKCNFEYINLTTDSEF